MKNRIGKNDLFLIILLFIIISVILIIFYSQNNLSGDFVTITVNGNEYGRYSLLENKDIEINNNDNIVTNILRIENGKAFMIVANCPDKLCMHQKKISLNKESIICLPNKVVITVDANNTNEIDAISQ